MQRESRSNVNKVNAAAVVSRKTHVIGRNDRLRGTSVIVMVSSPRAASRWRRNVTAEPRVRGGSLLNYAAMPVIESSLRPVNELNEGEGSAVGHRAKRILSIGRFGKTAPEVLVFKGDDIFGGEISDSLII